jgi:amino acid adenylation domain-containing protein
LLKALVSTPDANVFTVDMLSPQERHQLLVEWNDTAADYPTDKCIHELFEAQVENNPGAIAVIFEDQQLTYGELNQKANQLAHYLINEKHVKPDTLVGICVERSLEMVIGILAILKAGGAYVPLDPEYPEARLKYMLDDANLTTVLTQNHLRETTPVSDEQAVCLDDENIQAYLQTQSIHNPDPNAAGLASNHLAYVIYTSGSTGNPKGVMIEHNALVNRIDWMNRKYGSSPADRILQKTPFSFDVSVWEFVWPLTVGAGLVLARPEGHKDPAYLSVLIHDQQITKVHFVPSMLSSMLSLGDLSQCTTLRQIFCSGEALSLHHVNEFQSQCPWAELHNLYGPTEAAIDVSYWDCSQSHVELSSVPIGRPIHNIQLLVLNHQLNVAPEHVVGELHIGGVGLARGYLNRPELTAEKFIPNPFYDKDNPSSSERLYKTGDLARWLPDGNLEYLGRIDHQVKIRGFRIELGEIENTLSSHADVKDAIVLAKESPTTGDKRLIAYVATEAVDIHDESEAAVTARHSFIDTLRHHLNKTLPDYMVPSAFVLLDTFPLTPNGKVDRKALPEPDMGALQATYVAPRTETEKILCEIWQEVLGVERVGITDNFFQLGGHSLSAMRVVTKINLVFCIELTIKTLFSNPTVAYISTYIEALRLNDLNLMSQPDNDFVEEGSF